MEKIKGIKVITNILILILITCSFLMVACNDSNTSSLTENEVIAETKLYLLDKYSATNVYNDINLVNSYSIDDKYTVCIFWESSNNNLINSQTGTVNRASTDQYCSLTATIIYSNTEDTITFNYILPANVYSNSSPSFKTSGQIIQIEPATIHYNSNGTLYIELYVFNNLDNERTLRGLQDATISIYKTDLITQYLVKEYNYINPTEGQFSCAYHDYVKITLNNIPVYLKLDLARGTYKAALSGTISYTSSN